MDSEKHADGGYCPNAPHHPNPISVERRPASPPEAGPLAGSLDGAGAPPCNTAPANYSTGDPVRVLRAGTDSLYLSLPGSIHFDWDVRLRACKAAAASLDATMLGAAQVELGGHLFEVGAKGAGLFAYVLTDNWYRLQIASLDSHRLPLCFCRISSELLTRCGQDESVSPLFGIVSELGDLVGDPKVSRVDLCVDFVPECSMLFENRAWVRRAHKIHMYSNGPASTDYTGCMIGTGGMVVARIYDKTAEIKVSGKRFFYERWIAAGWDGMAPVWRLEFQFKREFLMQMGLNTLVEVTAAYPALWQYATQNWLRL